MPSSHCTIFKVVGSLFFSHCTAIWGNVQLLLCARCTAVVVAERLWRRTWNPLGSPRAGLNPADCVALRLFATGIVTSRSFERAAFFFLLTRTLGSFQAWSGHRFKRPRSYVILAILFRLSEQWLWHPPTTSWPSCCAAQETPHYILWRILDISVLKCCIRSLLEKSNRNLLIMPQLLVCPNHLRVSNMPWKKIPLFQCLFS